MIAIPAIDIREGACVQLVGGSIEQEKVRIADPATALDRWESAGFQRIHVVDLDAALDAGDNVDVIDDLLSAANSSVQVGGGVRTSERVDQLLVAGADHVIVGTRAFEELDWLDKIVSRYPGRIIVAADVRERHVVTRGWAMRLSLRIDEAVDRLNSLPLGGLLVTAVHVEGKMSGPDVPLMSSVVDSAAFPVIASGGIGSMNDLRTLQSAGVAAAVIGMALYTGALDARSVAEEFYE